MYLFSGSKVIAEYQNGAAPSAPTTEYVYAGGALVAKVNSSGTFYYHQDHLSNRMVTNSSGGVYAEMGHFPFGEAWYNATSDKLYFTTYEYDAESGNHYAMARYHVSRLGRYSSPDPPMSASTDPQSLNRYAYVANDPCNFVDSLGLDPCPLVVGGVGESSTTPGGKAVVQFAESIGANVVFPFAGSTASALASIVAGTPDSNVLKGIAASSGNGFGPTAVITFSGGAAAYNSTASLLNQGGSHVVSPFYNIYVMPGATPHSSLQSGLLGTYEIQGKGPLNDFLNLMSPSVGYQFSNNCAHLAVCAMANLGLPRDVSLALATGPRCETKIFENKPSNNATAGGGGGGSGGVDFGGLWLLGFLSGDYSSCWSTIVTNGKFVGGGPCGSTD